MKMEVSSARRAAKEGLNHDETRDPAYFSYYAQFVHQQNMLQDTVRTSLYHSAIMGNSERLFRHKIVMDVGAGSGILSYFAVKAGAARVFAVEASGMASKIQKMVAAASSSGKNAFLKDKVHSIHSKVEDITAGIPRMDTIVSEPIGVLLLHERMVESFIYARDAFLKPGGTMMPNSGTIFLAPFTDAGLWTQTMDKVRFWEQNEFFGVDFSPLRKDAMDEVFAQPIVGNFDHRILMATSVNHFVDFQTCSVNDLKDIVVPISWTSSYTGIVHGVAGWFDIDLCGYILSTAPNAERTHWQQVRFMLKEPIGVNAYETITGWLRMTVNAQRSYDVV
ncbi:S-adenosyl-L-methionine-dependent methyltransferase, partial [Chytriomyces sp. MP71]